jgi:hypothetical protein
MNRYIETATTPGRAFRRSPFTGAIARALRLMQTGDATCTRCRQRRAFHVRADGRELLCEACAGARRERE